jgi:flagellar P-ring protein precursor FlgI
MQAELAGTEVRVRTISRIETERAVPSRHVLVHIARRVGRSLAYFLNGDAPVREADVAYLVLLARMRRLSGDLAAALTAAAPAAQGDGVEIGSVATVTGVHAHPLAGYGLVVGLAGTGDSSQALYTTQTVANMLARFGVHLPPGTRSSMQIGNVAAVVVTGDLPAFAPEGSHFAVTASSIGNAKSLQGGVLLETPLEDAQGHVHAVAQGPLSIGGVNAQQAGSQVQINHPTVGLMPDGGLVVDPVEDALTVDGHGVIRLALRTPDYATADEVARAISMAGLGQAAAQDASTVAVVPSEGDRAHLAAWLGRVLRLRVTPHAPARVVLNERTGTIVAGGDVHLLPAAVAHGSIKVVIRNTTQVSQPGPLSGGATVVVPNAQISVQQGASPVVLVQGAATLGDLVAALNALGVPPRDLIAIIEALKEAGALQEELVVL